jgi:hypothetical protein
MEISIIESQGALTGIVARQAPAHWGVEAA